MQPGTKGLSPRQVVLQIRILSWALLAGMLLYAAVVVWITRGSVEPTAAGQAPLFGGVLAILGLASLVAAAIANRAVRSRTEPTLDSPTDDRKRLAIFFGITVAKMGLAEGFGLVGTTFMLVTGNFYFLAAPVVATAAILCQLPRHGQLPSYSHSIGPGPSSHSGAIEP